MGIPLKARLLGALAISLAIPLPLAAQQAAPVSDLHSQHPAAGSLALRQKSIPLAFAGHFYRASVLTEGGAAPFTVNLTGDLPDGLVAVAEHNLISLHGIPTTPGIYQVHVSASDANGNSVYRDYEMNVQPNGNPPPAVIADAERITATDTDKVFFPAVIGVTESTHVADSDNEFGPAAIRVPEAVVTADQIAIFFPARIAVPEGVTAKDTVSVVGVIGVTPTTIPAGTYNVAYSQTFTAVGNTGAPTLTIAGTLPTGLSIFGNGSPITIAGTPTQTGSFPFTVTARDTAHTSVVNYTLVIDRASQAITIGSIPPATYPGPAFTLTATSSSGLPVTIVSTSSLATGSNPFTPQAAGQATFQATQAGDANYLAAPPVNFSVPIKGTPIITWNPSTFVLYTGQPFGNGVLDATSSAPGSFAYRASLQPGGFPYTVTASTVEPKGSYLVTAQFTPTDTTSYTSATAQITVDVVDMNVFIGNGNGTVTSLFNDGSVQSSAVSGGGTGMAVDSAGTVWSIASSGSTLSRFTLAGALQASYTGGGLASSDALAIDGQGAVWVLNSGGTLSVFANSGTPRTPAAIAGSAALQTPTGIAVDSSGNLWIANSTGNSVTEILGAAAPVITPLAAAVSAGTPATKP